MRATLKVVLLCGVLFAGGTAEASTVIEGGGSYPYQRWVDRAKVPTPDVTLTVVEGRCPGLSPSDTSYVAGCTQPDESVIWVMADQGAKHTKATFLHELGHRFDYLAVDDIKRDWFLTTGVLSWPWRQPEFGSASPHELFADAYQRCALGDWHPPLRVPYVTPPFPNMRQICYVIRH